MRNSILVALLLVIAGASSACYAQSDIISKNALKYKQQQQQQRQQQRQQEANTDEVLKTAATMPQFPGGDAALMRFIAINIRYPQTAQDNNIQGKVVVQFVVTKTGQVGPVNVVRGVDPALDAEAVRVCKLLPDFSPGRNSAGEPVNVWYTLPINFRLQSAKSDQ